MMKSIIALLSFFLITCAFAQSSPDSSSEEPAAATDNANKDYKPNDDNSQPQEPAKPYTEQQ